MVKFQDWMRQMKYKIKYGSKFKKLKISNSVASWLINREDMDCVQDIFKLISTSESQEDFSNQIKSYLKNIKSNYFSPSLLLGNILGEYSVICTSSFRNINIEAFTKENKDLLEILKSHFYEYVINNNQRKNVFAETTKIGDSILRDLTQDLNEDHLIANFENILKGECRDQCNKLDEVFAYIIKTIGTYTRDDLINNMDFVLYDIDNYADGKSLDERRSEYLENRELSSNQRQRITKVNVLKQRLEGIKGSEDLLAKLKAIEGTYRENIDELDNVYAEYEILYRQDLIDNLFTPQDEVTVIENYKDLKPQLIHVFFRPTEKLRNDEITLIKQKIINERLDGNKSSELTEQEQEQFNKMINVLDVNLDPYKVNHTLQTKLSYSDQNGFYWYRSDTTNQLSASLFNKDDLAKYPNLGIIGIGLNGETLNPEAIAMSSNEYKTTNRGLNNVQYSEQYEFEEMSAPFQELKQSGKRSEIVMHRRGMDFDTKASYILVAIDSSNAQQTEEIMAQVEEIRKKEGLKVVILDVFKIKETKKQIEQESNVVESVGV